MVGICSRWGTSSHYRSARLSCLSVIGEQQEELEEELIIEEQLETFDVEDINKDLETEGTIRRKQLEKMAKEKPEEFAKLLRTWIAEE